MESLKQIETILDQEIIKEEKLNIRYNDIGRNYLDGDLKEVSKEISRVEKTIEILEDCIERLRDL